MISLHQLFRLLSRVSVDPATPFYAASLHSPIAGAPEDPRGPHGPPSPLKLRRPPSDTGVLMTCTTTSPAQGAVTPEAPSLHLDDALCDDADSSSTFPFSSSTFPFNSGSGMGELEKSSAVTSLADEVRTPPRSGGLVAAHERLSALGKGSDGSDSGSPPSTSATSPLLCPSSISTSPSLSACSHLWAAPPLLPAKDAASTESLLAALVHPEGPGASPFTSHADQLHQQDPHLFSSASAAAASAALSETQEEVEIEGPSGSAHRPRRRRCWRQQTPWGTDSRMAGADEPLQQRGEHRMMKRRNTSGAASGCFSMKKEMGPAVPFTSNSSRKRVAARRREQQGSLDIVGETIASPADASRHSVAPVGIRRRRPSSRGEEGASGGSFDSDSRLLGVCFSPPKDVWRARITVEGKQFEQQFSVKRHGFDGARILATRWRAEMESARLARPLPLS